MKKIISFLILLTVVFPAISQQKIFIQVEGINGESMDAAHRNWIEASAYSGGATNSGTTQTGGGTGAGKSSWKDNSFTICMDKSVNPLRGALASGKHIPSVNVEFGTPNGDNAYVIYAKILMEEVLVTSLTEGTATDAEKIFVNVSFNFGRIRYTYYPIDPKTGKPGAPVVTGWNIAENIKW